MNIHVQVLKFGGTSVGNGERIRRVAHIIEHTANNQQEHFPIVVVSAMAKVTDQLLRIARTICDGDDEATEQELTSLRQKHLEAVEKAITTPAVRDDVRANLTDAFLLLERDVATLRETVEQGRDVSLPTAAVAAWGERLSVLLVAGAVRDTGTQAVPVREELIITGYPERPHGAHGEPSTGVVVGAEPLTEETQANAQRLIHPLLEQQIVPVVAGFIGHTPDGIVTTLGRNGSDYSATVIGAALDCTEVTIYTDVDGVLTADPRLVMNTRLLPHLSYAEAARLSWFGAKVLHPRTLIPIAHRNIPVRVRNTFHPRLRGTVVGPDGKHGGATAITVRRHLALITVESTDLFGAPENAGQVFALAARAGAAPVAICSSSGHHLSFVVEEQSAESVVTLLQQGMDKEAWRVRSREGLAACACIGSGFIADPMSPARAVTALVRERIPIVTQGASELGITLIVEDIDSERALRSLHRDLIAPVIPLVRHAETRQSKVVRL
ncbi:MAG TPA: aspartate kinase [Ktedonobacteraceae bacterium]|nr:aspartate kinase [Ktedonobacteraceae bacterium]